MLDVSEITTTAPAFYAILPFTPIIGVLIFDGKWGPQLHIITILVICMLIASILEFIRSFNTQKVFSGLEVAYRGMADAFANVVMLLVAAGVFAQGLSTIGFIQSLISIAHLVWFGEYHPDAGISDPDNAGGSHDRFRQCAVLCVC